MQAPVMRKMRAARAEKGWCEGEVLVLLDGVERKGVGRTPERARALACSTVWLARRGLVVLSWRW